jgi:hypothetical protein
MDDECHVWATCDQVIADRGPPQRFVNPRDTEARQADGLVATIDGHRLPVPAKTWPGRVACYDRAQPALREAWCGRLRPGPPGRPAVSRVRK